MTPRGMGGVVRALRLMSFNLRRDVESDGADRWSRRRGAVARLVERHAPHVVGTQEGLPHQLADLDARLPRYRRVGLCRDGDGSGEHVALYYDASRLILVAWGDLWLSDAPNLPGSRSWGNRLPRMVTWARFTDQETGASFTCANTHLDHESAASRERSARFLAERFPEAVVMGDLNDAPETSTWSLLLQGRRDAHGADAGGTFHGFTGVARERLDGILVPDSWSVLAARVLDERVDGRLPSDHFPVMADVSPLRVVPEAAPRVAR